MSLDPSSAWYVYIIKASDSSLYTGISTDPQRRFNEHQGGAKQAKYFRGRAPISIEYIEMCQCRRTASQREYAIKKLTKTQKLNLIKTYLLAHSVNV
ncbi:GIY-YIG nuclease family protein [Gayadomonas joobiniege]|uniref:GIY-YIG nuclease family protein n=1 Tax=Gayadomonas joobiniege TaxID=1234606 RepID=UPI0004748B56|nr:GIY-YIG nuclease family protein [Gayadomonas joobiniege]